MTMRSSPSQTTFRPRGPTTAARPVGCSTSAGGESPPVKPGRENGDLPFTALAAGELPTLPLAEALRAGVSCRTFRPDALPLADLATVLRCGYGVEHRSGTVMRDRPPPSGGGLYPLEISLLVREVSGGANGNDGYLWDEL